MPLADRGLLTVIIAACHRGANTLVLAAEPIEVNECNCSICRRYGVLWAYYAIGDVTPTAGAADIYSWDDRSIAFHRCSTCGCVTHWAPIDRNTNRMGVNARLLDPHILAEAKVRHLDGAVTEAYLD